MSRLFYHYRGFKRLTIVLNWHFSRAQYLLFFFTHNGWENRTKYEHIINFILAIFLIFVIIFTNFHWFAFLFSIVLLHCVTKKIFLKYTIDECDHLLCIFGRWIRIWHQFCPITSRFCCMWGDYFWKTIENEKIIFQKQWLVDIFLIVSNVF